MRAQTKIQDSCLFHKQQITFIFTQPRHQHTHTCGTRINAVDEHTTKYNLEHTNLEPRPMHPLMINRFRSSVSDRIGFYVCFLCTYTRKSVFSKLHMIRLLCVFGETSNISGDDKHENRQLERNQIRRHIRYRKYTLHSHSLQHTHIIIFLFRTACIFRRLFWIRLIDPSI